MKLYRNAIILVVVLGLLVGAYVVLKGKKGTEDPLGTGAESIKLTDTTSDEITELIVEKPDEKFVIRKNDTDWVLAEPSGLNANASKLSSVVINASSIIADKVVEEDAKDLAVYGLDKPVVLTLKLKDGAEKALEIGSLNPVKDGYYIKEKGLNKVYTVSKYTGDKLLVNRNDIRETQLFTFKPEEIKGFAMERKGQQVFSSRKTSDTDWELTSPIQGTANTTALGPMLDAITQMAVQEFIEDNPADLGKYGLANPAYAMEADTPNGKVKVLLGSEKEKGSSIYAKLADKNEVFTVPVASLNFLDKPLKEIIEVFAYIVNIQDVNTILLEMDGQKHEIGIQTDKDDSEKDKFTLDGKDASMKDENDKQPFREFYQALIGISLDEIETGATPTGTPEISITYNIKKTPNTMKVDFISKNDQYYYVMRNGQYTGILVKKAGKKDFGIEGMKESFSKLQGIVEKK